MNSRRGAGAGSHQVDTGLFASAKRQVILRAGHALPDLLTGRLIDPGRKKGIRTWRAVHVGAEERRGARSGEVKSSSLSPSNPLVNPREWVPHTQSRQYLDFRSRQSSAWPENRRVVFHPAGPRYRALDGRNTAWLPTTLSDDHLKFGISVRGCYDTASSPSAAQRTSQ